MEAIPSRPNMALSRLTAAAKVAGPPGSLPRWYRCSAAETHLSVPSPSLRRAHNHAFERARSGFAAISISVKPDSQPSRASSGGLLIGEISAQIRLEALWLSPALV